MMNIIMEYLSYPFVQYALITAVLIALCAAVLGVTLVLKRFSFIGDGLSHVAFGAMAVAGVLDLAGAQMAVVLPVTVICAVLLLRMRGTKVRGDAAIAAVSVGALAFGYLIMNAFSSSANVSGDVCSSLFGSTAMLSISETDLIICVSVSVIVLLLYVLFYNRIFAVTFDEEFFASAGKSPALYNTVFAVVCAVVIVLAMKLVGTLMTSALIVFPALCSMRVFKSFRSVVAGAAVISVIATALGLVASILLSTPSGATIVAADVVIYILFVIAGKVLRR